MDVLGGRTLATYDVAQLLANKPEYVGAKREELVIDNYQEVLAAARTDMTSALEKGCGQTLTLCSRQDDRAALPSAKSGLFMKPL